MDVVKPVDGLPAKEVEPIFLSKREAAKALHVSERTLDRWRESHGLPWAKPDAKVLFPLEGIREWARQQTRVGPIAEPSEN